MRCILLAILCLIVLLGIPGKQGIVNRDIKLENTLLDNSPRPLVKLCDFGYSKVRFAGHSKNAGRRAAGSGCMHS